MTPRATRLCPDCGAPNALEATACVECNHPLVPMAVSESAPAPPGAPAEPPAAPGPAPPAPPSAAARPAMRPRRPRPPAPGPFLPASPEVTEEPGKIIPRRRHARVGLFGIGAGQPEPAGSAPSWIWLLVGAAALVIAVGAAISITAQKPPLVIPGATRDQVQLGDSLVKALARDSLDIVANIELGNLYYDTHNFGDAVRYYRRALSVHPDLPDVRVDMAVSLHQSGHTPEALGELGEVIAAHPEHVIARLDQGIILEAVGRVAEAESAYKAVSGMALTPEQRDLVTRQLAGLQQTKSLPATPGAGGP